MDEHTEENETKQMNSPVEVDTAEDDFCEDDCTNLDKPEETNGTGLGKTNETDENVSNDSYSYNEHTENNEDEAKPTINDNLDFTNEDTSNDAKNDEVSITKDGINDADSIVENHESDCSMDTANESSTFIDSLVEPDDAASVNKDLSAIETSSAKTEVNKPNEDSTSESAQNDISLASKSDEHEENYDVTNEQLDIKHGCSTSQSDIISEPLDIKDEDSTSQSDITSEQTDIKNEPSTPEDMSLKDNDVKEDLSISDESSDFIGFESTVVDETVHIFQILQETTDLIAKSLEYNETESESENAESERANSPPIPETSTVESKPECSVVSELNSSTSEVDTTLPVEENNPPEDQVQVPQEKSNDEQSIGSSKRIKKKRKFFDEFEETEQHECKKPHLSKERDETPKIDCSLSENKENFLTGEKLSNEEDGRLPEPVTPDVRPVNVSTLPAVPKSSSKSKKKSSTFHISNPEFKEPFKYGWRREVVIRYISEDGKKTLADVSYFSPQGKKLRSNRQIAEHLPSDCGLTLENFTFSKELIFGKNETDLEVTRYTQKLEKELMTNGGVDLKEILNDRKPINNQMVPMDELNESDPNKKSLKRKITPGKPKSSSGASSKQSTPYDENKLLHKPTKKVKTKDSEHEEISSSVSKLSMPKIVFRGPSINGSSQKSITSKPGSLKIKIASSKPSNQKQVKKPVKKKSDKSSKSKRDPSSEESNIRTLNSDYTTSSVAALGASSAQSTNNSGMPTCSIMCPLALGIVPTFQCTVCLCLYHSQCCGFEVDQSVSGYVCKNCQQSEEGNTETDEPPLSYKVCERLMNPPTRLRLGLEYGTSMDGGLVPPPPNVTKNSTKIVDGVTTWLPSSSNIQFSAKSLRNGSISAYDDVTSSEAVLQGVIELNKRRYIIVPKQSTVSVSPNAGATVNAFAAAEYEDDTRMTLAAASTTTSDEGEKENLPNRFLANSSNVNSAGGVLLVPVMPPGGGGGDANASPQHSQSPHYLFLNNAMSPVDMNNVINNQFRFHSPCRMNTCNSISRPITDVSSGLTQMAASVAPNFSVFTLSSIACMYEPLVMSLKYLTVRDLLRVSMTSKFLNRIASDPALWKTIRLKNSQIHDWKGFAKALQKHRTRRLDMRKMLCSSTTDELAKMWSSFLEIIPTITSLEHIDFSRAPTVIVDAVAATCPNLSVINALYLKNDSLPLENFTKLKNLKELRLKGMSGVTLEKCEGEMHFVNCSLLQKLSLTNIRNLDMDILNLIGEAENLVVLELGECATLPAEFANAFSKLNKLEKLRLEKVQNLAPDYAVFSVIKDMKSLKCLELINIDVKPGFDVALAACTNLEQFLIIPTYITQSATTNQLVINGVRRLSDTVKCFVWGLTLELLKVTDLFMDQWHTQKGGNGNTSTPPSKREAGHNIPVLKSVDKAHTDGDAPTQVDILPIPKLEKMLTTLLPNSRIKLLKIPFSSTWRQSMSECFK